MLLKSVAAVSLALGLLGVAAFALAADVAPTFPPTAGLQTQDVELSTEFAQPTCCAKRAYCCTVKRSCCGSSYTLERNK